MAQFDDIFNKIITDGNGVYGIAVIEISTRKLIASAQQEQHLSSGTLEALAVSAVEMVRGKAISAMESLLSSQLETPIEHCIEDVCINTNNARFFISIVPEQADFLVVLGTDTSVNTAMGWVLVKRNLPAIAAAITA